MRDPPSFAGDVIHAACHPDRVHDVSLLCDLIMDCGRQCVIVLTLCTCVGQGGLGEKHILYRGKPVEVGIDVPS